MKLEGNSTQCKKSDFYDLMLPDFSLVFTRGKPDHDARRSIWTSALSSSGEYRRPRWWRFCVRALPQVAADGESTQLLPHTGTGSTVRLMF